VSRVRVGLGHNHGVSDPTDLPEPDFPVVGWGREGYDAGQVDAFVDELRRSLRHDPPTMAPYEVTDQRFAVRRRGRGYSLRPVDDYLDRAHDLLRERHGADAVASLEGHSTPPEHFPTWWIYVVALVLVVAVVVFTVGQL
jgi:DivIVA domain-containing protein